MEPGGKYFGHFTSITGRSCSILEEIVKSPKHGGVSMNSLIAIGCDGANVNTGFNGVMIEHYLRRPLPWFICMLHTNELLLRQLFSNLDGKTSGLCCFYKTAKRDRLKISLLLKFLQ